MITLNPSRTVASPLKLRSRVGWVAAALVLTALPNTLRADSEVYRKLLPSTTWIVNERATDLMTGSGVLVNRENRTVVTNYHVVHGAKNGQVTVFFPKLENGKVISEKQYYVDNRTRIGIVGRILASDLKRDLAIVQLESIPDDAPAVEFAAQGVGPGEQVHSVGNPGASGVLWAYTSGTVRAVYKKNFSTEVGEHNMMIVESQSPINPGDSGGPVVNGDGKLVAISQALDPQARLISYMVDLSEVTKYIAEDHPNFLGDIAQVIGKAGLNFRQHDAASLVIDSGADGKVIKQVFVSQSTETYGDSQTRKIWALGLVLKKEITLDMATRLLQQNSKTKLGGWVIDKNPQGETLLIFCATVDATLKPEALKATIEYVSRVAASLDADQLVAGK